MNRKLLITVVVILLATLLFYMLMVFSGNISRLTEITNSKNEIVHAAEPPFRKDGMLTFYSETDSVTSIEIEIANDENEQAQGLMYRKQMCEYCGMLFIFNQSSPQSFWMKNTIIPLDILYVDTAMKIVSMHKYTKPYSEDMIPSNVPAQYVVEVIAGFSDEHKITEGHTIRFTEVHD